MSTTHGLLIGVVSDTHGYFDPRLATALQGVDLILHAGDVGSIEVLRALATIAAVHAVFGNNDLPLGGLGLTEHLHLELGGVRLHVVHELPRARPSPGARAVIFGHSHRQLQEWRDGVLYLNPGAAGRRGFHKLQTAALLRIESGELLPEAVTLGPRLTPAAEA